MSLDEKRSHQIEEAYTCNVYQGKSSVWNFIRLGKLRPRLVLAKGLLLIYFFLP